MYSRQNSLLGTKDVVGCPACGNPRKELITKAHLRDDVETSRSVVPLCWNCHWLYDGHVFKTSEVLSWFEAALRTERQTDPTTFYNWVDTLLERGERKFDRALARDAANKAWKTRRSRDSSKDARHGNLFNFIVSDGLE